MKHCEDLEPLLTPYVDGEATAEQCVAVEAHLADCPSCRQSADAEAGARHLLVTRRIELREPAPPALHEACARLARTASSATSSSTARASSRSSSPSTPSLSRRWMWLPLAATVLLVVGGVFGYGLWSDRGVALAAQLAMDHMRCVRLVAEDGSPPPTVDAARAWLAREGWTTPLPASSTTEDLEFVAMRLCRTTEGETAHAIYRHHGRLISLFILPRRGYVRRTMDVQGRQAVMWSEGSYTYAVIGETSPDSLARVVAYFQRAAR